MRAALTIRSIETIPIRVPLGRTYRGSNYEMTHRSTIVTRLHTEEGVVGEAYAGDEDADLLEIEQIIHTEIEPQLVGVDAFAVERCWELARPATANILRDRRRGLVACACVDSAIWDAVGKALGEPLWRLWGGYRSSLPVLAIGGYYDSGLDLADEIGELKELGVAGIKLKVGRRQPEEDAARVERAREAGGADFAIAADANQGWTLAQATRFAGLVEGYDLLWLEEPCHWENDRRAMRDLRTRSTIRICAGQSELSAAGCRDLMADGAIDVCNFDASWSGGPTEWRRVAAMALTFDVQMAHHEEPQIAAHLLAAIPHGTYLECFHPERDPIWWNLVGNRPALREGQADLPELPGLGWQLDDEFLRTHRA